MLKEHSFLVFFFCIKSSHERQKSSSTVTFKIIFLSFNSTTLGNVSGIPNRNDVTMTVGGYSKLFYLALSGTQYMLKTYFKTISQESWVWDPDGSLFQSNSGAYHVQQRLKLSLGYNLTTLARKPEDL